MFTNKHVIWLDHGSRMRRKYQIALREVVMEWKKGGELWQWHNYQIFEQQAAQNITKMLRRPIVYSNALRICNGRC